MRCSYLTAIIHAISLAAAGPCDIYASANTPCIAAHGTTRALYDDYTGPLYQLRRGSDGAETDVEPVSSGGVADAAAHDTFCAGTTCLISMIYDQSGQGNHLTQAPPGAFAGPDINGFDNLASGDGAPVALNGQRAYGVFMSPGTGYRNNAAQGTVIGDEPQGMYAVLDGTHYNDGCCFDYGNAEVSSTDTGNGHMETIYFGNCSIWGTGSGSGPWIMADLENGLFSGIDPGYSADDPTISSRFVTTVVKGEPNHWAIRGGDSTSGSLSTFYDGARPNVPGYNPMSKEGAIILGIGGDNSVSAQGTFYEGVMTRGYPSDAADNLVQKDIVAAGYQTGPLTSGPAIEKGSSISIRATPSGYASRYVANDGSSVTTAEIADSSDAALRRQASWTVRAGFANSECVSLESMDTPGSFLRHNNFVLVLSVNDGSKQFREDSTFCHISGFSGQGNSLRAWNYPTRHVRHHELQMYVASNGGVHDFDSATSFNDDATWVVEDSLA